ncbi:hypothetical protein VUR80DRAFT_6176 [Thermomyces stellatus]
MHGSIHFTGKYSPYHRDGVSPARSRFRSQFRRHKLKGGPRFLLSAPHRPPFRARTSGLSDPRLDRESRIAPVLSFRRYLAPPRRQLRHRSCCATSNPRCLIQPRQRHYPAELFCSSLQPPLSTQSSDRRHNQLHLAAGTRGPYATWPPLQRTRCRALI